jgi:hypothetical protein
MTTIGRVRSHRRQTPGVLLAALIVVAIFATGSSANSAALGRYHYCTAKPKLPIAPTSCTFTSTRSVVRWNIPDEITPDWYVYVDGTLVACSNFYRCSHWLPTGTITWPTYSHRVDLVIEGVIGGCGLCVFYGGAGEIQDV